MLPPKCSQFDPAISVRLFRGLRRHFFRFFTLFTFSFSLSFVLTHFFSFVYEHYQFVRVSLVRYVVFTRFYVSCILRVSRRKIARLFVFVRSINEFHYRLRRSNASNETFSLFSSNGRGLRFTGLGRIFHQAPRVHGFQTILFL